MLSAEQSFQSAKLACFTPLSIYGFVWHIIS